MSGGDPRMHMKKPAPPWWQIPALIGAGLAGLTALGTVAINYATYAAMPEKVKQAEQKNVEQDQTNAVQDNSIDDLKGWAKQIQGYTQAMQQQQHAPNQAAPIPQPWTFLREEGEYQVFKDPGGETRCCDGTTCEPLTKKGKCPR